MGQKKLKKKIAQYESRLFELRKDIRILLSEGNTLNKIEIKSKYDLMFDAEKAIRSGDVNSGGDGLFSVIDAKDNSAEIDKFLEERKELINSRPPNGINVSFLIETCEEFCKLKN